MSGPYIPVPRYLIGTFEGRSALYREYFAFSHCDTTGFSQVGQAVNSLGWDPAAHQDPAAPPAVNDYQSLWPVGMKVSAFSRSGSSASITITEPPKDAASTELALQELVYTVTAADNTIKTVTVTMPVAMDSPMGKVYPGPHPRAADRRSRPGVAHLCPGRGRVRQVPDHDDGHRVGLRGHGELGDQGRARTHRRLGQRHDARDRRPPVDRGRRRASCLPNRHYYVVTAFEASAEDGRVTWPDSQRTP